ncbi:sigma 54-interacting transcriptional regulator [Mucilaginibacter psychrotolerans]|uniref:AAA family ATPase n=1 Tax=Mucilaginibacter psychrotolerans TaxID=1524096 RepID=A0A4Y8SFI8_9SPHI|nr:sigma 54-interacting transcriptional regulator [Mucilaginibacter psychrotolerans]TFF37789.1 AAA family ATPase [Mucilaginibacter psychrotolerans]
MAIPVHQSKPEHLATDDFKINGEKLNSPGTKLKISVLEIIEQIREDSGAGYTQIIYDPVGDYKFRSSCFCCSKKIFGNALHLYLQKFAEEEIKGNASAEFSTEGLENHSGSLPAFDDSLTRFQFLPVYSATNRYGVLILGCYENHVTRPVPKITMTNLVDLLRCEKERLVESKERVYKLNKALIKVQGPKLLGDVLKHQINPLFNLKDSAIIYTRDGKAANEYHFYFANGGLLNGDQTVKTAHSPNTIGADSYRYFYEKLLRSNDLEPFFKLNIDRYADKEDLHPFFSIFHRNGYREAVIVNLRRGAEMVGFWVMIFNKGHSITDMPDGILDAVSIQLAATVHCVNTFFQLESTRRENEVLQALNVDLAATRDKGNLLNLIRTRLLTLFQFSHHFICKIHDDQMTVGLMLLDSQSRSQYHPSYETVTQMHVNIADGVFNKALMSSKPVVFDLEKLNEQGQLPLYLQINYDSGIKKIAMLALRVDSRMMGIWCVAFTAEQPVLPRFLELLRTAGAPISIAVANIRMNESLKLREAERDKLMDLSSDLTTVKSKEEFVEIIEPYLRKLFAFSNLSIFVDQEDYESRPFIYFSDRHTGTNVKNFSLGNDVQFKGARVYSQLLVTTDVRVMDMDKFAETAGTSAFFRSECEDGIRTAVLVALRNDNRQIGVLSLYLSEGCAFSEPQLHLFKEVSYQIAKAVSNILYNEEIAHRKRENELLLALSEDIAAVREKGQLIQVINERLKPILKFTHISLSIKRSDNCVVPFLNDPGSKAREHVEYQHLQRQDISQCLDFINFLDASPVPVIISENQNNDFEVMPKFVSVNLESGIEEILIARLFDGVAVFGYCVLFFDSAGTVKSNQFSFIQGIANQFSTAIYNINANLEIAEKQKENELLISLSNDSSGLRNYFQLVKLVSTKLRSVFRFKCCYMAMLEEDDKSYEVLLPEHDVGEPYFCYEPFPEALPGTIKYILSENDQPQIIERTAANEVFWKSVLPESNLRTAVVTKFMHDSKMLAIWIMFYQEEAAIDPGPLKMLKGIGDQLSIAIANIRINERLANNERQKGLLLSLSTRVSSARNPVDLLKVLALELKTVLGFSHGSIVLFDNKEKTFALPWVLPSESKSSNHPKYKDITSLTPVYDGVADLALKSDQPLIIDIAAFPEHADMPLYMRVSFECGMTHVVFIKLIVNGEILGFWVLWYDSRPGGSVRYLELVEQIANVLAVPISNISFNEQINKREQEKSNLLDFIGAIAGVKEKFELRRIFHHYLKNLCFIEDICLHWFTDDKKYQFRYFWNEECGSTPESDPESSIPLFYPVDDIIYGKLKASGTAKRFSIGEIHESCAAPPYLSFFEACSFTEFIGVPLFKGKEMAGILFVKEYDANIADQPLFKGLCAQLAIAVSDLVTTDKVAEQLSEINRYKERLEEEKIYLKQELETSHHYSEIIGESLEIKQVFQKVSQVASSDSTVLILGETGTGKELIARAIHNHSLRQSKLMVKVNCAALPANLIESELFGHERGSFTGATEKRIGKFELANGGSLFLDEVGELPLELQVKFLRALQEREIERIGGRTTIKVDVRIIAATNRNLENEIAEGRFRSDLYFRLSTFPITLPPLRDRRNDIPVLATHFVNRFGKKTGKSIDTINQRAMQELVAYSWPGNVRELEHQIERSVLLATSSTIKTVTLPAGKAVALNSAICEDFETTPTIDEHERALILRTLKQCFGKISGPKGAAALLGVPSSTLNSKMKRLGIKKNFLR